MQNIQKDTARAVQFTEAAHEEVETVMRQSTAHQQGTDYALQKEQEAIFERVDPYTLQVISQLFPAPSSGLDFVARILRYAQIIQNTLPGLEDLGDHVAVINTRTIRTLAGQIQWGYDTTHKYVTTFCAFGLLRRYKYDNEHTLVFPLKRYSPPPSLDMLDRLIVNSRPKVQQFAKKARERFVRLNLSPDISFSFDATSRPSESEIRLRKTLSEPMLRVLQSEGIDSDRGKTLVLRLIRDALSRVLIPLQVVSEQEMIEHAYDGLPSRPAYLPPLNSKRQSSATYMPEEDFAEEAYPGGQLSTTEVYPEGRLEGRLVERVSAQKSVVIPGGRLESPQVSSVGRPESSERVYRGRPPVHEEDSRGQRYQQYSSAVDTFERPAQAETIMSIYEQAMDVDWQQCGLPEDFFVQLYQNMRALYETSVQKGFMAHTQLNIWRSVERNQIRKLAYQYGIDFVEVYNTIMCYTGREKLVRSEPSSLHGQVGRTYVEQGYLSSAAQQEVRKRVRGVSGGQSQYRYEEDYDDPVYRPEEEVDNDQESEYQHEEEQYTSYDDEYQVQADEYQPEGDSHALKSSWHDTRFPTEREREESEYQHEEDSCIVESSVERVGETVKKGSSVRSRGKENRRQTRREKGKNNRPEAAERPLKYEDDQQELPRGPQTVAEMYEQEMARERALFSRIPFEVDQEKYSQDFLRNYVTEDIITCIKNIYNTITLRNELSTFFAEIFDRDQIGNSRKWYAKLLKDCDAEQLCAGFIDTIVLLHRPTKSPISQPGGFFNRRCVQCRDNGIDAKTRSRMEKYGSLVYKDFAVAMADLAKECNNPLKH